MPLYTHAIFERDDRSLAEASLRKFAYCFEKCRLKPGDHMLEVGPGWGAWFNYASQRGVKCTGLTISRASIDYLEAMAKRAGYDWELIFADLLEYKTDRKYDAIVMMGVIEHLPQYEQVLAKFDRSPQAGRPSLPRRFGDGEQEGHVVGHHQAHLPGQSHAHGTARPARGDDAHAAGGRGDFRRPAQLLSPSANGRAIGRRIASSSSSRFGELDYRRFAIYPVGLHLQHAHAPPVPLAYRMVFHEARRARELGARAIAQRCPI